MRKAVIIIFLSICVGNGLLAATQPLKFDPATLDRADRYLSIARKAAEAVNLKQLPSITSEVENRIEFSKQAIVKHAEIGQGLVSTLRKKRSIASALMLSELIWNVDELLIKLTDNLFQAAKAINETSSSSGETTPDKMKRLDESSKARSWAMAVAEARLGEVPGEVSVAAFLLAGAADNALDQCEK